MSVKILSRQETNELIISNKNKYLDRTDIDGAGISRTIGSPIMFYQLSGPERYVAVAGTVIDIWHDEDQANAAYFRVSLALTLNVATIDYFSKDDVPFSIILENMRVQALAGDSEMPMIVRYEEAEHVVLLVNLSVSEQEQKKTAKKPQLTIVK